MLLHGTCLLCAHHVLRDSIRRLAWQVVPHVRLLRTVLLFQKDHVSMLGGHVIIPLIVEVLLGESAHPAVPVRARVADCSIILYYEDSFSGMRFKVYLLYNSPFTFIPSDFFIARIIRFSS